MSEVTLKGELHNSREDLKEEKELIQSTKFSILIQEGKEVSTECKLNNPWYALPFCIFSKFYYPFLLSYDSLLEEAKKQGVKPVKTRENDLKIYEEASFSTRAKAWLESGLLSILFSISSVITFQSLIPIILTPLIFLGIFPGILRRLSMNYRNEQIAEIIIDEFRKSNGNVLVITGNEHAKEIQKILEEKGIQTNFSPAHHGVCSLEFWRDFASVPIEKLVKWAKKQLIIK